MEPPVPAIWRRWLLAAAGAVVAFGLMLILAPATGQAFFNTLFFGSPRVPPGFSPEAAAYIAFVYGVLGAVMIGWMTAIAWLVRGPFRRGERRAWDAIAVPLGVWFVLDGIVSLAAGFAANLALNAAFAVAFAVPLAATYRAFHPRTA